MDTYIVYLDLRDLQQDLNGPVAPSAELARALAEMVSGASDTDAETLSVAVEFLRGDLAALARRP